MKEQKSFVVTIQVGDATSSHVWDSRKAMPIGHPFRWVLERTESGAIQVRNIAGAPELEAGLIPAQSSSHPTARLTASAVEKGAELELPEASRIARSKFTMHIKPVLWLAPAYETHDGGRTELRVYECFGDWTQEAQAVNSSFIGRIEGKAVFKLEKVLAGRYTIISMKDGLTLGTSSRAGTELASGERHEATAEELHDRVIRFGDFTWRLEGCTDGAIVPAIDLAPPIADPSSESFKQAFKYACAALMVFALTASLWPKTDNEVIAPQTTRLVLKKPVHQHMTSAVRGDLKARDFSMGTTKTSKPRGATKVAHPSAVQAAQPSHKMPGAVAKKKTATPAKSIVKAKPKSKPVVVVAHVTPKPKTVSKPVAHVTPKKVSKPVIVAHPHITPRKTQARASYDPSKSQMARAFQGVAFKSASQSAVNGGMTRLLKQSRFGEGSDSRYGAQGMLNSRSALRGSGGYSSGTVGTSGVEVATLGGGGSGGGEGGGGNYGGNGGVGYGRGSHALVSGQGKSFISMDTGASEVDEGLTKEQVAAVFNKHKSEIRYCHESALLRAPGTQGKLQLKFTINGAGSVKNLNVAESAGDSSLDDCITRRLVTWKFPQPRGGVNVAVNRPILFKTLGR